MADLSDDFSGTDFADLNGRALSGGTGTWSVLGRTWHTNGGKANSISGGDTAGVVVANSSTSDVEFSFTISGTIANMGLFGRSTTENVVGIRFGFTGGNFNLYTFASGGGFTQLASDVAGSISDGDVLTMVLNGTSIVGKKNGTTVISGTTSDNLTNTRHGMIVYSDTGTRFDDFTLTDVTGGGSSSGAAAHYYRQMQ